MLGVDLWFLFLVILLIVYSMVVDKMGKVLGIILLFVKFIFGDDLVGLCYVVIVGKVLLKECDIGN